MKKKLVLTRESIRVLGSASLGNARGGANATEGVCGDWTIGASGCTCPTARHCTNQCESATCDTCNGCTLVTF